MHFKKTPKKYFRNNFSQILQILLNFSHSRTPSPNFHSGKSYVKKISVYFLAVCANFPCKIEKFELENVRVGILGTGFYFQGSH